MDAGGRATHGAFAEGTYRSGGKNWLDTDTEQEDFQAGEAKSSKIAAAFKGESEAIGCSISADLREKGFYSSIAPAFFGLFHHLAHPGFIWGLLGGHGCRRDHRDIDGQTRAHPFPNNGGTPHRKPSSKITVSSG